MSAPEQAPKAVRGLCPLTLLLGLAAGLAILSWLGRDAAKRDWHTDFTRFHPMISPEAMYEPTVEEMCAIVRARCKPDRVLVIVGGNSILLGVGQPAEKMWTLKLQEVLGDRYAVVNLAFRGASPNDAGAIVAETLRNEYPHQIYIANESPFQSTNSIGIETYRFVLLDAYYKGFLLPWPQRDAALSYYLRTIDYRNFHQMDLEIGAKLDSWLYFHNFWNWVSYSFHFTFGTTLMPRAPEAYWPRSRFADNETDFDSVPLDIRFTPQVVAADLDIVRKYTAAFYHEGPDKAWVRDRSAFQHFIADARAEFPDALKPRTLVLVGSSSPYYTRLIDPAVRARNELAARDTINGLKSLDYEAIGYGDDFAVDDYGDRIHLTSSGGAKLAAVIAPTVEAMARKLNYLP